MDKNYEDLQANLIGVANQIMENSGKALKAERYSVCKQCDAFSSISKFCGECGCFMPIKTLIKRAECPKGKW
jgi:ribosomal protein L32